MFEDSLEILVYEEQVVIVVLLQWIHHVVELKPVKNVRESLGLLSIDIRLQTVRDARVMDHQFVKKVLIVIQSCIFIYTPSIVRASIAAPIAVGQATESFFELTNLDW